MIDPKAVFNEVKRLLDFPEEDTEKMTSLCESSANKLSKRLKETCTGKESEAVYAAAALTAYRYALVISCSDGFCDYIKTGDLTVRRSASSYVECTERLLADAFSQADCFTDIGFIFQSC